MPSLREAMRSVAENTSKILSPDAQGKVVKALKEVEAKYEDAQGRLRKALFDKVSLENEVLYLRSKLEEVQSEVVSLGERAAQAVAPAIEKVKPKAKPLAKKTKKTTKKK
jgi:hypothetical protein